MNGWLVVNGFLRSKKFEDLYSLLSVAFESHGSTLEIFDNTAFATPLDEIPYPIGITTTRPDFVLFWDKDVALARRFEDAGIAVFNSAAAIACCDDKLRTAQALVRHGVPTPRTICAPMTFEGVGRMSMDFLRSAARTLGFPMVMKEAFGSFGEQVYLAQTMDEAEKIVREIGHRDFLMQEFVGTSRGRDMRINVVGGEVVTAICRRNAMDFRSNVTHGGDATPATPTPAQHDVAIAACRAVNADFAGVDVLFGPDDTPLVCEVNSNPHFRSTLDCTGVNMADSIAMHVLYGRQDS